MWFFSSQIFQMGSFVQGSMLSICSWLFVSELYNKEVSFKANFHYFAICLPWNLPLQQERDLNICKL